MPEQLHSLFLTIFLFGEPEKPQLLCDKYKELIGEDLLRDALRTQNIPTEQLMVPVDNEVLLLLEDELTAMDRSSADFDLPTPDRAM